MSAALRTSPLHDDLANLSPRWATANGMPVAIAIDALNTEHEKMRSVGLADRSYLKRVGLKGPGAQAWLQSQHIATPEGISQWSPLGEIGLIARLGGSEFFIEDGAGNEYCERVRSQLGRGLPGVTPVMRQDAEIALCGVRANELLLQTCSFNFAALDLGSRPIVMTSMIGVSVLVIARSWQDFPFYQIWCDPTYAAYLWKHLLAIAIELDGGAVGLATMFPNLTFESQ